MCPKRIGDGKERIIIQENRRGTLHVPEEASVPRKEINAG